MKIRTGYSVALIFTVAFMLPDVAQARNYCPRCFKPAPIGARLCQKCIAAEREKSESAVKSVEKVAQSGKIVLPDKPDRIKSFCGYVLGSPMKRGHKLTGKLNGVANAVVVEEKMKKPFRFCTMASLSYSQTNGRLYEITLSSQPQRMSEKKAMLELEGIVSVLSQKFSMEFGRLPGESNEYSSRLRDVSRDQSITVKAKKVDAPSKLGMKGLSIKDDSAYAFFVVFQDRAVQTASVKKPDDDQHAVDKTTGADVL